MRLLFALCLLALTAPAQRQLLAIDHQLLAKADVRAGLLVRVASNGYLVARFDRVPVPADFHILHHHRGWAELRAPMLNITVLIFDVKVKLGMGIGKSPI